MNKQLRMMPWGLEVSAGFARLYMLGRSGFCLQPVQCQTSDAHLQPLLPTAARGWIPQSAALMGVHAGAGATWAELNELLGPHSLPAKASTYNYSMNVDTDKD